MFYPFTRKMLFKMSPEKAHAAAMRALEIRLKMRGIQSPPTAGACTVMGLDFENPVGLAAGFDKNGAHVDALGTLGFGFIEIGAVTPKPQDGNPKPRIFRIPRARALINRMGFNNIGATGVIRKLQNCRYRGIIGINLGKNADTPNENAIDDYLSCLQTLYPRGDFFVVNISSPNTPGLRDWQHGDALVKMLAQVTKKRDELELTYRRRAPIAVKISPDLTDEQVFDLAEIVNQTNVDGVVATNTTTKRPAELFALEHSQEKGGLSGAPLAKRSTGIIRLLREALKPETAIIGVGGIDSVDAAHEKLDAGANLVQLYTGLIYEGSKLPMNIINSMR